MDVKKETFEVTIAGVQQRLRGLRDMAERQEEENIKTIVRAPAPDEMMPDGIRMHVYWLGCRGAADLSATLPGRPQVARIGCTIEPDIDVRLCTAARDAYGSWSHGEDGVLREEPGFSRWVMQAIRTTRDSVDPAIGARTRTIEILLPPGMSRRLFDYALHKALSPWSLADRYPDRARYTRYSMGADRMSRAKEIYVGLDPRHDGDRLLALVEGILVDHRKRNGSDPRRSPTHPELPCAPPLTTKVSTSRQIRRRMSPAQINAMQTRLRYGGRRKIS